MLVQISRQVRRALERRLRKEQRQREKHGGNGSSGHIGSQRWIPHGETVEVAGRKISGMIYFGIPVEFVCTCGNVHKSGVCIDPTRTVAKKGDSSDDLYLNTDDYQKMGRYCRANYLDWLADGKSNRNCSIFYPTAYFCGLERRFILDNPTAEEKEEILFEVNRLQYCFRDNDTFCKNVNHFLNHAVDVTDLSQFYKKKYRPAFKSGLVDRIINVGNKDSNTITVDVETSLDMLEFIEIFGYSNKIEYPPMFFQLFRLRFSEKYPNGLALHKPQKLLERKYYPVSHEFTKTVQLNYNKKPLFDFIAWVIRETPILAFAREIDEELEAHTDFIFDNPSMLGSVEAMAFLPSALRNNNYLEEANFNSTLGKLSSWAQERAKQGLMVTVEDAVNQTNVRISKDKVTNIQWEKIEEKLASCGFGIAPNINLWLRQLTSDDSAAIYKFEGEVRKKIRMSQNYRTVLTEIAIGAYLFQLERRSTEESRRWLSAHLAETKGLTNDERTSLTANIDCVLSKPHDRNYLRRLRSAAKEYDKEALRAVAVKFANSDRVVRADSVSVVEQIYSALGFEPKMAYSDLHAGEIVTNETGVKRDDSKASELNEDRIKSIRSDTERVSKVLGDIFVDEENEKTKPVEDQKILVTGLDHKHARLLKSLMEREHWTEDAFGDLAKEFGLLPVGALETINEWVFDRYEEPLVDEHDGFHLIPAVTKTLKAELEGMQAA